MTYRQGCGHTELIQRHSLWLNTQREDFYPRAEFCFLLFLAFCRAAEVAGRARGGWVEPSVQVEADHLLLLLSCLGEVVIALRTPEALIGGRGGLGSELVWVQCEKCLGGELELPDSCQVRPVKWWLWCAGRWECPRLDACMGWQSGFCRLRARL